MTVAEAPHAQPSDVMRGIAGAVLLGVPLLYTQEIWSHGQTLSPLLILAMLAVSFGVQVELARHIGFRPGREGRSVEEALIGTGLSVILATVLLFLLDRIQVGAPGANTFGKIGLVTIPLGLGFAVGSALAPREGGEGAKEMTGPAADFLAAAAGVIVLALNIAPTEEPIRIAQELDWIRLGLLVVASIVLPYLIVFEAEFSGKGRRRAADGATQRPLTETLLAYMIAFAGSAILLACFGRIHSVDGSALASVVTLAFPGSLGAALGRMLV
jgi:putative integral membrane protein (TIGR02587 family)